MRKVRTGWLLCAFLVLLGLGLAVAQEDLATKANALFKAGKRPEALPLYEELAKQYPKEWLYAERLADCLGAKSTQTTDPAEVKALRLRIRDAAQRAIELGDTSEVARLMANLDPDAPVLMAPTSPGGDALQQAEKAFTAGNYKLAFDKYTEAAAADPTLYEAALFAGDTAFVQGDLKEAAKWFQRAIQINPNRETAYRYWGDAIMKYGNDPEAAKQKFIDALVAEPYNRLAWQGLKQWAQIEKAVLKAPEITVPGQVTKDPKKPNNINITMDFAGMDEKKHPGSAAWLMYTMMRASYQGDTFKKEFPNEKQYRHSLKEEDAAFTGVAESVEAQKIKRTDLDQNLRTLMELSDAGMIDCFILINAADEGISHDYDAYRNQHRKLLHDYVEHFLVHGGVEFQRQDPVAGGKHGI
jgi:tetratricopeptide (TPR) repeat protein